MFEWEKRIIPDRLYQGDKRKTYWLITRGGTASIFILAFHGFILLFGDTFLQSPVDPQVHLLATSTFASGLLTFVLIAVYRDIGETQSDQKEILENQNSLMEASNLPSIDTLSSGINNNGEIEVQLENTGNGPANSLSATIHFHPVEPDSGSYSMPRFPNRENRFRSLTRDDSTGSTTIRDGRTDTYLAQVMIPDFTSQSVYHTAGHAIRDLTRMGIEEIDFQMVIRYDHLLPTKGQGYQYLQVRRCDISQGSVNSMYDIWDSSDRWVGTWPSQLDNQDIPFRDPGLYYES